MVTIPLLELPSEIAVLRQIALDLRWTWSHEGDALWGHIDEKLWERTLNPWTVLQGASRERLKQLSQDQKFLEKLNNFVAARDEYLNTPGWFRTNDGTAKLGGVAYFSMEFGLGSALPIYAGGLGILAGDVLKSASDLDIPVVGIGLLYQEGYFRQLIDGRGMQQEFYPYNEPSALPVEPVILPEDGWLKIGLELPDPLTLTVVIRLRPAATPDRDEALVRGIARIRAGADVEMRRCKTVPRAHQFECRPIADRQIGIAQKRGSHDVRSGSHASTVRFATRQQCVTAHEVPRLDADGLCTTATTHHPRFKKPLVGKIKAKKSFGGLPKLGCKSPS